ncbi:MAG: hypothetical protein ACRDT8_27135, partial [Micromonosporaceae bacterium]
MRVATLTRGWVKVSIVTAGYFLGYEQQRGTPPSARAGDAECPHGRCRAPRGGTSRPESDLAAGGDDQRRRDGMAGRRQVTGWLADLRHGAAQRAAAGLSRQL